MEEPNIIDKAKNLTGAVFTWATKDGCGLTSEEVLNYRKSICNACPHWDPTGYANVGKCLLCGCSVGKLYFPSAFCPDTPPRWLSVPVSGSENISPRP
jgi:hypothetical protein